LQTDYRRRLFLIAAIVLISAFGLEALQLLDAGPSRPPARCALVKAAGGICGNWHRSAGAACTADANGPRRLTQFDARNGADADQQSACAHPFGARSNVG